MPIKEKPQLLEFNCTLEGMDDISWNIKYNPNDKMGLQISGNGQNFHCPVELFGDVTAFLQSKNVIKPNVLIKGRTVPGFESGTFASHLMPPKVEGQPDKPIVNDIVSGGPPMDALASFDITNNASNLTPSEVPDPVKMTATEATEETEETEETATTGVVVTSNTKSEIINRPVIRTRVNKDDPQSAEKEAAVIRGKGAAGAKKTIKKRHQVVE